MCRFVAYCGDEILLADVLVTPKDSLVKQSLYAKESVIRTNGDGFGIGWYVPQISPDPAVFVSVLPAWNDMNLLHLTSKTKSSCFFGHVRAANIGTVAHFNCHPFAYQRWMLMHNGDISHFMHIKRELCNLLDQDIYNWIKGQTDTEHFFALFLQLAKKKDLSKLDVVVNVIEESFQVIDDLLKKAGQPNHSYFNLCLTDGQRLIATRYCVNSHIEPESLHYLAGPYFPSQKERLNQKKQTPQQSVLIASEMLTDYTTPWSLVPPSHFICVDKHFKLSLRPIQVRKT